MIASTVRVTATYRWFGIGALVYWQHQPPAFSPELTPPVVPTRDSGFPGQSRSQSVRGVANKEPVQRKSALQIAGLGFEPRTSGL
jgi:hypothetical protein